MKLTIMTYVYPMILSKVVKEQLIKYYSEDNLDYLLKNTGNEYKEILRRSPDIGGNKNSFMGTFLMGVYLVALYKNTKDKLSLDDFDLLVADGLRSFKFMKKQMKKEDLLSIEYKNKIKLAGKWFKKNEDKYPDNWQVEVRQEENTELTNIVFTKCALCVLCKNEGVGEFISSLCATDYITMSFSNCNLYRPTTLGKGDSCCDFYITRLG
ncbi:L-2-amino-thiazoline-4-carboxylic acid hydrolase [Clostridium intestinale]|uniref:L-2-amino-thiazoline-4-carboxylic acid hydrolase n=1 Tax=Clostridium intestinale DSM 6191 TaxID=1121320 RepID=A0A1M5Z391_9CLOT|nr:L-2-amino-thiazoline-4-carboxylic acid hydrolase [Clostridium intestinale]SHI18594.1 L-2-amino-thiazoline-4-carboxylic acid hydrolase [Clostridium intestinale DSM 6191]